MSKYELPVLSASDMPRVAFESMNDTHFEELELINKLGASLLEGLQDKHFYDDISDKLSLWVEHTREHFANENQLMENCSFPALAVHSGEHQRVIEQLEKIQAQWLDQHQVEPLAEYVFNDWVAWFDQHVNTMDMMTAQYLSQVFPESET
ncbi:hypothetical protein MNBD_GAMMA09-2859 [hydrothermal vent metagenome]|uniref:Hemerythrin-like domain-containing protein n=1 Tax=hydrothermal vent metagenome TaxID=652676 RepID=A0A3B0Y2L6_9ZZZZ